MWIKMVFKFGIIFGLFASGLTFNITITKQKVAQLSNDYNILFGVGTSAVQIEGAWNESGKGESIWDHYAHDPHSDILQNGNGDVACDSYHRIDRDIQLLKDLRVQMYKFSISWTRVLPTGFSNSINQDGLNYYHKLIDKLRENNIIPVVVMHHWDLPQSIHELGGWMNELTIEFFEDYAKVLLDNFAKKVEIWITINEPDEVCNQMGWEKYNPKLVSLGIGDYMCYRNTHLAHARVYHMYKNSYDTNNLAMMGLSATMKWFEPLTESIEDIEAAERTRAVYYGLQAHPIYSKTGDFPTLFKERVANKSRDQGFVRSRLPAFTIEEVEYIRQSYDFFGLNYYTAVSVQHKVNHTSMFSMQYDLDVEITENTKIPSTEIDWLKNYPQGLRKVLNYVREHYENPLILITENGCGMKTTTLNDDQCVEYLQKHLEAVYDAVAEDKCNVRAYSAWSLMDNFEWMAGYTMKFGLYQTNFNDFTMKPKASAKFYQEIMSVVKNQSHLHPSAEMNSSVKAYSFHHILYVSILLSLCISSLWY